MVTYTHDNLPEGEWASYRKLGSTRMIRITGPCTVETKEGAYELPNGWQGYLALDNEGDPYPITAAVHSVSYERVEQ